jgi:hypothetical protein
MANEQQNQVPPTAEQQEESSFRSALADVCVIVKKLAPHCKTVQELIDLCSFAQSNNAQLRMLMNEVTPMSLRQ